MRQGLLVGLAGSLALLLAAAACTRSDQAPPANVVLLSIDSLRADHLGAYGYAKPTSPTIDRLAAEGLVFESAFSTTSWTLPAHVALFSGRDDLSHTVISSGRRVPAAVPLLAEVLRQRGYQTLGMYSGPFVSPAFGFGRGFDAYVDCTAYGDSGTVPDSATLRRSHRDVTNPILLENLSALLGAGVRQPFLLFIHLWDVHYDYIPPERYWRLFDPDYAGSFDAEGYAPKRNRIRGLKRADFEHLLALYDGEIRYTDDTIRAMLEELRRLGLLDDTLVIVTADHGEEFLDHGGAGHRHTLYDEVVRVPLILWHPGRVSPGRDTRLASLTDVAPTILDFLSLPPLDGATGESLLRPPVSDRHLLLALASRRELKLGLRSTSHKLLVSRPPNRPDAHAGPARVIDLHADPGERRARRIDGDSAANREILRRLETEVAAAQTRGRAVSAAAPATPVLDDTTRERLRALGYE